MNYKTNVVANKIKNFGIKISDLPHIMKYSRSQLYVYLDAYEREEFDKIPKEIIDAFKYLIENNPTLGEFICHCEKNISEPENRIPCKPLKKDKEIQIKTFVGNTRVNLEEVVNRWLKDNNSIRLIDIKYQIDRVETRLVYFNALVIYEVSK